MKFRPLLYLLILVNFSLLTRFAYCKTPPSIWDVLREEFTLDHEVTRPEVQKQLRWLTAHPSYVQELSQSKPYIYHIVTEIRKRKLPGELALIPMIESTFDPFVYSSAGAAGLWQIMPQTARELGLERDWWFDGRRSIGPSTNAALNYLVYLHKFFHGDWILAIAAYDSGEGTIARAIKKSWQFSSKIRFWRLSVPGETKAYIPRILALAEIIQHPQKYKIKLPSIVHAPYFEEVDIGGQIDLNHAAKLAGISYKELIQLNPGYNRWATAPNQPFKLLIPTTKVAYFCQNLAKIPSDQRVSLTRYLVHKGENLENLARKYATTASLIRKLNQLKSDTLKIGEYVLIPVNNNLANSITSALAASESSRTEDYKMIHIVQAGDTFQNLAKKYRVSTANIRYWNKLGSNHKLKRGDQLLIWRTKNSEHEIAAST